MERTFDWRPVFDERSRDFPIRAVLPRKPRYRRSWKPGRVLDQGAEGACVGHGWAHEALASPVRVDLARLPRAKGAEVDPQRFAFQVYRMARRIDEWPGEAYEGTSVLAGCKIMKQFGLVKEYRWAFSVEDVRDAILYVGPAVLGVNWYSGMYSAPHGNLNVHGSLVGGHCILAIAYDPNRGFLLQNSWGADWGVSGLAWISIADMRRLLSESGEACVPYRRSYGRA